MFFPKGQVCVFLYGQLEFLRAEAGARNSAQSTHNLYYVKYNLYPRVGLALSSSSPACTGKKKAADLHPRLPSHKHPEA